MADKLVTVEELKEAKDLLREVRNWDEEEVRRLPYLYRKKAEKYRDD